MGFRRSSCLAGVIKPGRENWRRARRRPAGIRSNHNQWRRAPASRPALADSATEIAVAGMIVRVRGRVMRMRWSRCLRRRRGRDDCSRLVGCGCWSQPGLWTSARHGRSCGNSKRKRWLKIRFPARSWCSTPTAPIAFKLLFWDGSALMLVSKRLDQGAFKWPPIMDGVMRLNDGSERLTVPVRLKGIRLERSLRFGDGYLALALWRETGLEHLCEQVLPIGKRIPWAKMAELLVIAPIGRKYSRSMAGQGQNQMARDKGITSCYDDIHRSMSKPDKSSRPPPRPSQRASRPPRYQPSGVASHGWRGRADGVVHVAGASVNRPTARNPG